MTESAESKDDVPPDASNPDCGVPLESILCTEESQPRLWRAPDYVKENRALVALTSALAESPHDILQTLAETILEVTRAHSAGVSLLTTDDGGKRFYWSAIAGIWKPHIGGGTPRNFGPCGDVLDRDIPLLFRHLEMRYTYFQPLTPPPVDSLLVPFHVGGRAVGTIWALMHNDERRFDAEDERLMGVLGKVASLAYQTLASIEDLKLQIAAREKAEADVRELASGLEAKFRRLLEARLRRRDGVYRWFLIGAEPYRDESDKIVRWYGTSTDIDDRKRAEAQVEQAYLFLAQAQRLSKTGSWSWNASTGKVVWSQEHFRLFGLDPQDTDPSLDVFWERVHPDDRFGLRRIFESAIRDKRDFEQEFRIVTPDGAIRHLHGVGHAVLNQTNELVEFIGSTMDITDRKRAQELAGSLVAVRADVGDVLSKPVPTRGMLQECAEAIVRRLDAAFVRIWTSNRQETMLELQASAGTYTRLDGTYGRIPFGDLKVGWIASEKKPHLTNDVMTDPRIRNKEWARSCGMVSFAGYPLVVDKRAVGVMAMFARHPLSDDALDTLASVADAIAQGIERKRAEAELRRSEAYLAEAQRLSSIGSFSWRVATDEITWSEQLYRIYEIKIGEPVTLELIRSRVHPEDRSLLETMKMVHEAGGGGTDFEWQYRLLMPDRSIKYLHAVAHATRDQDDQLEYIAAVQDVTESKVSEEALDRARAELAHMARVTTLSALTASIAHEINQPISAAVTSAGACLQWLNRDQPDVQRAREAAMRIEEDGRRAAEIITHLKFFYRKDISPQREMVSVNDLVGEMLVLLGSEADLHSVVMRTELAADLPPVSADRVQLQQVLMNLMLNGMEAMNEPGGELKISTRREGGEVMVSVSDTGVGIPADKMEEIFNTFVTTKAGGTGMGLAVSRTIIESHGGRLWATVNPGRGATFHFILPTEPEAYK